MESSKRISVNSRYSDEKFDMHPRSWLLEYQQTSIGYLIKMGLFYSALGLIFAYIIFGIQYFAFGYEEPVVPASLIAMITAGPIEETLFFGIPYAVTGNHFVVLGTGIIWASIHVFNASMVEEGNLSFANLAFAIPHIFFSLRAWKSGKGWFTIPFHSGWNAMAFSLAVLLEEIPFAIYDQQFGLSVDLAMIIISVILMGITYPLYRRRLKKHEAV